MQNQNSNKDSNNPNPKKINESDAIKADKAIELMRYNKINAKNAFDINVDFIESLSNILNKNEEAAWQKASAKGKKSKRKMAKKKKRKKRRKRMLKLEEDKTPWRLI